MVLQILNHQGFYDSGISIYDGSNAQSTQIAKLSGKLESFDILSTGNSLFVIFESNELYDENLSGFIATIHYGNPNLN